MAIGTRTVIAAEQIFVEAVVNEGIDWAAYWLPVDQVTEDRRPADRGDKMPESVARFFFHGIEEPYRW